MGNGTTTGSIDGEGGNPADDLGDSGLATNASLNTPTGLTVDAAGNVYIADSLNHRVRKVDTSGNITTVAGDGSDGFSGDSGAATSAQLNTPTDVAVDVAGNLYIADRWNVRVRKVDGGTGIITTVAGDGTFGLSGDGGPATSAQLNQPVGLAVDAAGDLYIAEKFSHAVRKVDTSTGVITTVAGNGSRGNSGDGGLATSAQLNEPMDVAFDTSGNLYIAASNNRIRKVDASTSIITTVAGGAFGSLGDGGLATDAALDFPTGVAVDASDNLFIADYRNHRIRRVDASTNIITLYAGSFPPGFSGDGGAATSALMNNPSGISVDGSGNYFITENENNRIRRVDAVTGIITTVAGNGTEGFCGDGGPATAACLNEPDGVAVDTSGNVFISDRGNHRIRRVDASTGVITTVAGDGTAAFCGDGGPATAACLNSPRFLAVDSLGNLYMSDRDNHRIRRVDASTGIITTFAGNGSGGFSGDGGPAASAQLNGPLGVTVGAAGNLYIADNLNLRVRKVDTGGIITTVAGIGNCCFSGDGGLANSANFGRPRDVVVDIAGNLFITDIVTQRVRKVDGTTGIVTTVAGSGSSELLDGGYSGDGGLGTSALLAYPQGVAVD